MIIYQFTNGYCYNSDTHFLFNFISQNIKQYKNIKGKLLDIGSGSGILGLMIARDFKKLDLNQCEMQNNFSFLTNKNSQVNKIKNTLYEGNFLDINFLDKFEYIVSNPPFYPSSVVQTTNKNKKIAKYNDNLPLEDFIKKVAKIITNNGKFFFCYDVKLLNNIMIYCDQEKLNIESLQFLHPKIDKEASLVMVMARKNSKTSCKILPPAVMFDKDGEFTTLTNKIYKKSNAYSIKFEL